MADSPDLSAAASRAVAGQMRRALAAKPSGWALVKVDRTGLQFSHP